MSHPPSSWHETSFVIIHSRPCVTLAQSCLGALWVYLVSEKPGGLTERLQHHLRCDVWSGGGAALWNGHPPGVNSHPAGLEPEVEETVVTMNFAGFNY